MQTPGINPKKQEEVIKPSLPTKVGTLSGHNVIPKTTDPRTEALFQTTIEGTQNVSTSSMDPIRKDEHQEFIQQYGNKAGNLHILDKLLAGVEGCKAAVPPFLGVSHKDVLSILEKNYEKFSIDWENFVHLQEKKQALTPEGKEQLAVIRDNIQRAFHKATLEGHEKISQFLSGSSGPLIVRSTGIEDTQQGAMAGANMSVPGVGRSKEDLLQAMGTVVASYFSEASLMQRILAGREIAQPPFIPVLLQEMIGEDPDSPPPPNQIQTCGVCYTQEIGGDTPNLTVIEATYGHNEGVVTTGVRTDKYYVYPEGPSHQVIVPKDDRLIAEKAERGEQILARRSNPPEIAHNPALSSSNQQKLQLISKAIHDYYGMPMDIEWIYDSRSDTFFIVQARPIKQSEQAAPRSVDMEKLSKSNGFCHKADKIVGRGGRDLLVTNSEQVIHARKLEDALRQYLTIDQKCRTQGVENPVKAVIVDQPGGELSHAACVFQENGIVVYAQPNHPKEWAPKGKALIFQLQGEGIAEVPIPQGADPQSYLEERGIFKEGWKKHPIPGKESVQQHDISAEALRPLYQSLLEGHSLQLPEKLSLNQLLEMIASDDLQVSNKAVKDLVFILSKFTQNLFRFDTLEGRAIRPQLTMLLMNIMVIADDMLHRSDRMQRLHAAKRIETLLKQESNPLVINSDSFTMILTFLRAGKKIAIPECHLSARDQGILNRLEEKSVLSVGTPASIPMADEEKFSCLLMYRAFSKYALTDQAKKAWQQFTDQVAASGSRTANQILLHTMMNLQELDVFPDWINHHFARMPAELKGNSLTVLMDLRREFRGIKKISKSLEKLRENTKMWGENYAAWEDPGAFDALWLQFERGVVKDLVDQSKKFIDTPQKMSPLEKQVFFKTMFRAVDVMDQTIKAVKSSPSYGPDQIPLKVERFQKMLVPYRDLMLLWLKGVPEKEFNQWQAAVLESRRLSSGQYREEIYKAVESKYDSLKGDLSPSMLHPSSGFNGQAAIISSGVDFGRSFPECSTLEDLFTFCHQNILAMMACRQDRIELSKFPPAMGEVLSHLGSIDITIEGNVLRSQIIESSLGYPVSSAKINLPIKNHAAIIEVRDDQRSGETDVSFSMFGHNLNRRMEIIAAKTLFTGLKTKGMAFSEFPEYDNSSESLHFSIKLSADFNNFSALFQITSDWFKDSLSGTWGEIPFPRLKDLLESDFSVIQEIIRNRQCIEICVKQDAKFISDLFIRLLMRQQFKEAAKLMETLGLEASSLTAENFLKELPGFIVDKLEKGDSLPAIQSLLSLMFDRRKGSRFLDIDKSKQVDSMGLSFLTSLLEGDWKKLLQTVVSDPKNRSFDWLMEGLISYFVEKNMREELDSVLDILEASKRNMEIRKYKHLMYDNPECFDRCTRFLQKNRVEGSEASEKDINEIGKSISALTELRPGDKVLYPKNVYNVEKGEYETGWFYATVSQVDADPAKGPVVFLELVGTVSYRRIGDPPIKKLE